MMRIIFFFLLLVGSVQPIIAQNRLDKTLKSLNKESVPYIQGDALYGMHHVTLLDTRELEEFQVSHLKNAIWVGAKTFEPDSVSALIKDKNSAIIVYCSIGVRSEKIGEKLIAEGYTNVKNLYGGIFDWKNNGRPVFDSTDNETEKVHAFNKYWGRLLKNAEKVYGPKRVIKTQEEANN